MNDTIERSQTHATFVIERTYPEPAETVWHALSDNDARDQWFSAGSTSLTTIVLEPDGDQTQLTYTEQAVHFDGLDSVEGREEGTKGLLDQLGSYLSPGR
jgi:uncharacterized protein YndB with AHSA1/START domain